MSVLGTGFALYGPLKKDGRTDEGFFVDINNFEMDTLDQLLVVRAKFYPTLTTQQNRSTTPWFELAIRCSSGTNDSTTDFHRFFRRQFRRDRNFFYRQYLNWILSINPNNDPLYEYLINNNQKIIFNPRSDFIISTDRNGRNSLTDSGVLVSGDRIFNTDNTRIQEYTVATRMIGVDPITTTSLSNTVTIADPATTLQVGDEVSLSGVTGTIVGVNGISLAELNKVHTVSSVATNSFTIIVTTGASLSGSGGGAAVSLSTSTWSNV